MNTYSAFFQFQEGKRLFAAADASPEHCLHRGGAPVWPCSGDGVNDLRAALAHWGVELELVAAGDAVDAAPPREAEEVVAALGTENFELARLYGFLTGREVQVVRSVPELARVPNAVVLVARWQQLRVADYEALYEFSRSRAPIGVLAGVDREGLFRRVLVSSALAYVSRSGINLPSLPSHAVLGVRTSPAASWHFDRLTAPDGSSKDVIEVLRGPTSILGFVGHSDGVDAGLSRHAVLCARVEPISIDLHSRPANCDLTGYCHRRHLVRSDALASGDLLSPKEIATRLFLMLSCYVARPSDGSVHAKHGLLAQLLANPRISAVVAPWEVAYPSADELLMLAAPLLEGQAIGHALAGLLASATGALNGCNRYLLFGDPAVRAHSADNRSSTGTVSQRSKALSKEATAEAGEFIRRAPTQLVGDQAGVVSLWLSSRLDRIAREQKLNAAGLPRVTKSMLSRGRRALPLLKSAAKRRGAYRELLRLVLAFEGSSFVHWFEDARGLPQIVDRPTFCFGCGRPGRLFRIDCTYGSRWMACCTYCDSFYADTPEGSDLIDMGFRMHPDGGVEHGLPEFPNAVLGLNLRSALETRTTWLLDEPFDFPPLPPGRSWIWLHALSDRGMYSYSRMVDNRPLRDKEVDPDDH